MNYLELRITLLEKEKQQAKVNLAIPNQTI